MESHILPFPVAKPRGSRCFEKSERSNNVRRDKRGWSSDRPIDMRLRREMNHCIDLFVVDQKETRYVDCSQIVLPYGEQLVNDVLNRTETAMTQAHCYLATELVLKAQQQAQRLAFRV